MTMKQSQIMDPQNFNAIITKLIQERSHEENKI